MKNFIKKILNNVLKLLGYKIVQHNTTQQVQYRQQVSVSSSVLMQGSVNYDFRVSPEDRKYVSIGEKCLINNATFTFETQTGEVRIGNNCYLGGVHFICRTKIEVEDDVLMAWGIVLYDHNAHSVYWEHRKNDIHQVYDDYLNCVGENGINKDWSVVDCKPIRICSKVWIGFDVLIMKGVTIGEGAVVGAKSVVTKDVPAWTVVAGNPARIVKTIETKY